MTDELKAKFTEAAGDGFITMQEAIRLLPRVFDVKAHVGPRVKDVRLGEPVISELRHTLPCETVFLAASPKRSSPEVGHVVPERRERPAVGRDCVVSKVPCHDLLQPLALARDGLMHSTP